MPWQLQRCSRICSPKGTNELGGLFITERISKQLFSYRFKYGFLTSLVLSVLVSFALAEKLNKKTIEIFPWGPRSELNFSAFVLFGCLSFLCCFSGGIWKQKHPKRFRRSRNVAYSSGVQTLSEAQGLFLGSASLEDILGKEERSCEWRR